MKTTVNEDEFLKLLYDERLYENIFKYIFYLTVDVIEFFQFGPSFLDDLFYSKVFKNLAFVYQMEILELLNKYGARFSIH